MPARERKGHRVQTAPALPQRREVSGPPFRCVFEMEVAIDEVRGENVETEIFLPFAPYPNLWIAVLPADDCREIEQVFWIQDRFECFLKFDESAKLKQLVKAGWRLAK